jgi:prenyltransferase beta subunit
MTPLGDDHFAVLYIPNVWNGMSSSNDNLFQTFAYLAVGILVIQAMGIHPTSRFSILTEFNPLQEILPDLPAMVVPTSQADRTVSVTYTDLPQVDTRDNQPELDLVGETLASKEFRDSKATSIPATYFSAMTLYNMGDPAFTAMIPELVDYLMSLYNPGSLRFIDGINYTYYETNEGIELLHSPYSPEISHYMAIILLARCGELKNQFSLEDLDAFTLGIWNTQNADGGFGVLHDPNSTLLETYFSVYVLAAIANFIPGFLFPVQILALQQFLRERQTNDYVTGPFNEFNSGGNFGWTAFLASWLALNTVELMGGDPGEYREDFVAFWQSYDLYNTETHCFYGSFNERIQPDITYFYGTAIVGDCIRIMEVEDEFPDLPQADNVLLNGTHYNQNQILSGPNYFEITSSLPIDDLWIQFLVTHYLSNRGKIDLLKDGNDNYQGLSEFMQSHFAEGGASALSQWETSAKFDHDYYSSRAILSALPIDTEELFASIMMKRAESQDHFLTYRTFETRYLEPAIEPFYNPVASSYHVISLLERFDLLMPFYVEVGMEYLDYERWFVSQLSPVGYFYDNSRWYSGNLESTYMALTAQNILITFNQGQIIENYYSTENISMILEYLVGFISENSDYWYASADAEQLDRFQATLYILQIFDILHHSFSDIRLEDWISMEISQSNNLTPIEFAHLCQLGEYLEVALPNKPSFSHSDVKTICDAIVTSDNLPVKNLQWLSTMTQLNNIRVLMDLPQSQTGNQLYAYSIQIVSYLSVESVENIRILGERTQFIDWSWISGQYEGTVIPEFNTDPTSWAPWLLFTWNGLSFESHFTVSLEFSCEISWGYKADDAGTVVWFAITIAEEIGITLAPNVQVVGSQEELIEVFSTQEIFIFRQGDKFNYSIALTESAYTNESFYNAVWNFNALWMDSLSNQFQFIMWEPSVIIPPDETTTDTMDSTTTDPQTNSTDPTSSSTEPNPISSILKLDLGISTMLFGGTSVSGFALIWFRKKFQYFV